MVALRFGLSSELLASWKSCGATPHEGADALSRHVDLLLIYGVARRYGYTHMTAMEMSSTLVSATRLSKARVTSAEASDARDNRVRLRVYLRTREEGATHDQALLA
jgi:hypothetical protein